MRCHCSGRLRRRKPGAIGRGQLVLYLMGLAVIVLALLSPIDTFATWLFIMHMVEHELLTMVAPPLLLLANPLPVILWGLPVPRVHGHIPYGFRIVYVIAAVGPAMLPAMSIAFFAQQVFYSHYTTVPRLWGLTALGDRAAGWVLMGVLDGMIYAITLLLLVVRMLDHEERMTRLGEAIGLKLRDARP